MKRYSLLFIAVSIMALGACAHSPHEGSSKLQNSRLDWIARLLPKKKIRPPSAAPVDWAGTIRLVNEEERFALVESETASPVIQGEKYLSIRNGQETGTLRITALKASPFLIADIVSGNPCEGDRIYLPRPITPLPQGTGAATTNSTNTPKTGPQN